ncbi:MAG TPA: hypothetical protein K8V56_19790 [Sporosarcina psychrophila]|uniref:Uncharacterized protein n=1 Tax=Sporosarcina psychrophila TaxID=1476 RepID=A0A921G203_SPOPS|nr:hypothetical protein [Sporosarcina psychrophila]
MTWENQAAKWLVNNKLDTALKQQLLIEQTNKELMEDSFYKNLSFGTAPQEQNQKLNSISA